MATLEPFKDETLIQYRLLRKLSNPVIRALDEEEFENSLDRRLDLVGAPDPVKHIDVVRAKATGVLKLLKDRGLELVDITTQVRGGKGGNRYTLLEFKFGTKPADRARRKVLAGDGMKFVGEFLDKPWQRAMFSTFPKDPDKCSLHFGGEITDADIAGVVANAAAAKYGLVTYEAAPKVQKVEDAG